MTNPAPRKPAGQESLERILASMKAKRQRESAARRMSEIRKVTAPAIKKLIVGTPTPSTEQPAVKCHEPARKPGDVVPIKTLVHTSHCFTDADGVEGIRLIKFDGFDVDAPDERWQVEAVGGPWDGYSWTDWVLMP